jgi:hypothetical protein
MIEQSTTEDAEQMSNLSAIA